MSRFYYTHPESSCAFVSKYGPEIVMSNGDGCVMEVDREEYLRSCEEWGIDPEPMTPDEVLFGDLL